jgi:hypothetical protein
MTRELALKNPGGIERKPGVTWVGQTAVQSDPTLVEFIDYPSGVRACVVNLRNYQVIDHLSTVAQAIERWSYPPEENDTPAYILDVCQRIPCSQADPFMPLLPKLLRAIFDHENGALEAAVVTDADIQQGINLAA